MNDAQSRKHVSRDDHGPRAAARARPCPICKAHVPTSASNFPFCSKRCRLVDLGQWFSESYAISRDVEEEDEV